jgi:hypothetical protein
LLGAKRGTQRVSADRRYTSVLARVALATSILLGLSAVVVTSGPAVSLASYTANTANAGTVTENSLSSTTYQENSTRIAYSGRWSRVTYMGYLGHRARYSRQRGASATFKFTGVGISWIGPSGPTRGKARIYINGSYVKTVSTYSRSFVARRVLFSKSYTTQRLRTLKIVVVGTAGHPTVAIDALKVRIWTAGSTTPPPPVAPAPTTPPITAGKVVQVASIKALKTALADNTVDQIVVANGKYHISSAGATVSDSLWIGGNAYANRTRPIYVRAQTIGGVTFDGGGGTSFDGAMAFEDGAHHQTWDGFNFANFSLRQSGVINFGGYISRRTPHHLTIRHIKILGSVRGTATGVTGNTLEHALYFAQAAGTGPHDLLAEDISVDGSGYLASAVHADHGDATNPPAYNVTIRRLHVYKTQQAIILWSSNLRNWTIDTADVTNALEYAVRYESSGGTGIRFANIRSTGSGVRGFYSSMGSNPPGVTFYNNSFH